MFKKVNVLIVEDDPICARNMHRYTETMGFSVKTVATLRTAVAEVDSADILILTLKVNGGCVSTDTLMEAWNTEAKGPLCVIADDPVDFDTFIQSGATHVLQKPVKMATYSAILNFYGKHILDKKRVEELTREIEELRDELTESAKMQMKRIWIGLGVAILSILVGGAGGIPAILQFVQNFF